MAVEKRHTKVVEILLHHKASPNAKDVMKERENVFE
ncbi:hypothetical protein [Salmonella enterica]